jgi:hypothetical protein
MRSEVKEEGWAQPGPGDMSAAGRPTGQIPRYFAVGIANSAPLPMLAGQRCMMLFCLV